MKAAVAAIVLVKHLIRAIHHVYETSALSLSLVRSDSRTKRSILPFFSIIMIGGGGTRRRRAG